MMDQKTSLIAGVVFGIRSGDRGRHIFGDHGGLVQLRLGLLVGSATMTYRSEVVGVIFDLQPFVQLLLSFLFEWGQRLELMLGRHQGLRILALQLRQKLLDVI